MKTATPVSYTHLNGKWHSWDGYYDGYYYGYSYVTLTANQYKGGTITAAVPSGATVVKYNWKDRKNVSDSTTSTVTISDAGAYSATCEVTFSYKIGSNRTVTDTVKVTISGYAYSTKADAEQARDTTKSTSSYGSYYPRCV